VVLERWKSRAKGAEAALSRVMMSRLDIPSPSTIVALDDTREGAKRLYEALRVHDRMSMTDPALRRSWAQKRHAALAEYERSQR
jgi:hypothetical protein